MTTWELMDGAGGRPGNLPSTLFGPGTGPFSIGLTWSVTQHGLWLFKYRIWVGTGADATARRLALWQLANPPQNNIPVPAGTLLSSGPLITGQWNEIPLGSPVNLSGFVPYCGAGGWTVVNGFTDQQSQFGNLQPFSGGIVNGPLQCYSDQGGSNPEPFTTNYNQGLFGLFADPTLTMPTTGDVSSNFGIDFGVTDQAPAGATYELWPNQPWPVSWVLDDTTPLGSIVTVGTEFALSVPCFLKQIKVYSPSSATSLPTKAAVFNVPAGTIAAGTLNSSPSWSGAFGTGNISVSYAGVILPAGSYRCCVSAPAGKFNATTGSYFGGGGPGSGGIVNGPLSAPSNAAAHSPGNGSYAVAADIAYPDTNVGPFTYWVGPVVQPVPSAGGGGDNGGIGVRPGQLFPSGKRRRGGRLYAA